MAFVELIRFVGTDETQSIVTRFFGLVDLIIT